MPHWKLGLLVMILLHFGNATKNLPKNSPRSKQGYFIAPPLYAVPRRPFQIAPPAFGVPFLRPRSTPTGSPPLSEELGLILLLLYAIRAFSPPNTSPTTVAPTTTTTTTTTASTTTTGLITTLTTSTTIETTTTICPWGSWTACSQPCKGTQTKTRTCTSETETQDCNTETGFRDGWYRAENCYEYIASATIGNYDEAVAGCPNLGAQLASTGLRDTAIRREIMAALYDVNPGVVLVFIGAKKNGGGSYDWTDGTTNVDPTFWDVSEPDSGDCVAMVLGSAQSGHDSSCNTDRTYLCERQIT